MVCWTDSLGGSLQTPIIVDNAPAATAPGLRSLPCPRCAREDTRPLGPAGSVLEWFACSGCSYVWSLGAQPVLESESVTRCIRTRVVIVDDDRSLLRGLELGLASYEPVAAQSATEALTLVQHCRPELLITDYLMPNISGAELIAQARAHQPAIKVILLTGHDGILEHEPSLAGERRLKKPCGLEQIRDAVLDLIGPPGRESAPLS